MKKILFLSIFVLATVFAFAQTPGNPPVGNTVVPKKKLPKKDGFIFREENVADTVVPYSVVNKEDVYFTKRVWREIDLRDRGNEIMSSPKVNLIGVIYKALNDGELDLYSPNDEDFQGDPISQKKDAAAKTNSNSAVDSAFLGVNPATNEVNRADNEFFKSRFIALRIKEDWILDIRRGIFEPRIVGVAPVIMQLSFPQDNNGNPVIDPVSGKPKVDTLGTPAVGWLYFDDLRHILVKTKVANNNNDNSGINFDDVFVRRLFFSNITKVSNTADERFKDYLANSKDQLLESERWKKYIADFEQGLWEY
ncbi:gliding motility protein GldN [Pedobacter frigiditerrae]|uniref:Gliding motility protein GldN n=1 Tax=Pedobacter frigiditerrae TaxID=2530452 RepID=A0A4R0N1Y5_9SPHI|nr:gliding motility protein GldN [Pedobacter frigiditerrae]TCC93283.1 gliding motility protein GldN [Pedobacter frigiditerrae]